MLHALENSHLRLFGAVALIVLPALAAFLYITIYGANVVFGDEFALADYLAALQARTLTFPMLFAQHNEHRILFPRIVLLATASLTHFNTKAEMYLYWLCLCGICGLFLLAYVRLRGGGYRALFIFAPVSFILFSFRQWENLLWGWQICWGMAALFVTLALYLLAVRSRVWLSFALAVVSGVVASFSVLAGLVVWPVGLVELAYLTRERPEVRRFWLCCALWLLAGMAVFGVYFRGFVRPAYLPSPLSFLRPPGRGLIFFLTTIGSPLSLGSATAVVFGALLLALVVSMVVWQVQRRQDGRPSLWVGATMFGLAAAAVVTVGRAGLGLEQAMASKYTVLGLIGIAGLYLWVVTELGWQNLAQAIARGGLLALLATGLFAGYAGGLGEGQIWLTARRAEAGYERAFSTASDLQLESVYPGPPAGFLLQQLVFMRSEGLNVFFGSPHRPAGWHYAGTVAALGIDGVNDQTAPPSGSTVFVQAPAYAVSLSGWAIDTRSRHAAGGVYIDIDGQADIPAKYGLDRPDVVAVFKDDAYGRTGFQAAFSAQALGPGRHVLSFRILSADRSRYYQPSYVLIVDVR
jgi:hypothetical protein